MPIPSTKANRNQGIFPKALPVKNLKVILLVCFQGSVLKKDFMTFYVNFPPEVIAATAEAAAVAEEGITVEPDVDLAEKVNHMIIECAS